MLGALTPRANAFFPGARQRPKAAVPSARAMRVLPTLPLCAVAVLVIVLVPADPTHAEEGALAFDKPFHDFGDVRQHEEHEGVFRYTNRSQTTMSGIRAIADCGCYGVTLSHAELEPGASGTLTVRFRTLAFSDTPNGVYDTSKLD